MLGGVEITARTRAHAEEMIGRAGWSDVRYQGRLRTNVEHQAMVFDRITVAVGNFLLKLLDAVIDKLDDLAGLQAHHVIVVAAVGEFEYRHAAFKVVPVDQPGAFELRQHPVDRSQAEFVATLQQRPVKPLRRSGVARHWSPAPQES